MTNYMETWTLTSQANNKLAKKYVQHYMQGHKSNISKRENTKVTDVTEEVGTRTWTWAGHVTTAGCVIGSQLLERKHLLTYITAP